MKWLGSSLINLITVKLCGEMIFFSKKAPCLRNDQGLYAYRNKWQQC